MAQLSYREAVSAAIAQEMRRDDSVVFLGEDIAAAGGVFKTTEGLLDEFGPLRVRDTPISEQAILGAAAGAAMTGNWRIANTQWAKFVQQAFCRLEHATSRGNVFAKKYNRLVAAHLLRNRCGHGFSVT